MIKMFLAWYVVKPKMVDDWCEEYRPKTLGEIIGNNQGKEKLREWARAWDGGKPKKRGVIIAGPPGIGKTSTALALAGDMGWEIIELNASDKRNYEAINGIAGVGAVNQTFSIDGTFTPNKKKLILLDEADNLFGREDRGGVQAIVEILRISQQPIILVVNDSYSLVKRSSALRNLTLLVDFRRPSKRSIALMLSGICRSEGIDYTDNALTLLAENCSGDIRGAIRDLEVLALSPMIDEEDVLSLGTRDREENLFRVLAKVFKTESASEARAAFWKLDESPDHFLRWVDENLPVEYKKPGDITRGFYFVSRSDLFLQRSVKKQAYQLWSYAIDLMTAGVATAKERPYSGFSRYRFPSYLKKRSSARKLIQVRGEIAEKIDRLFGRGRRNFEVVREIAKRDPEIVARKLDIDDEEISLLVKG